MDQSVSQEATRSGQGLERMKPGVVGKQNDAYKATIALSILGELAGSIPIGP